MPTTDWSKSSDGFVALDAHGDRWRIRGPIMGQRMYWLYFNGTRVTPTGRYNDVVNFASVRKAKAYVRTMQEGRAP